MCAAGFGAAQYRRADLRGPPVQAAKIANVFLGKRMGKLERELTAFAESVMRDKDNVKESEPVAKGAAAASTNDAENGSEVDPPVALSSPDPASDLHDRISALESELRSTRRALDIVVEAFGRDAVVDKLQQARKPHTSRWVAWLDGCGAVRLTLCDDGSA